MFEKETVNNEQKMHSFHPLSRVDKSIFFHLHLFYTGPFTAIIENDIVCYVRIKSALQYIMSFTTFTSGDT